MPNLAYQELTGEIIGAYYEVYNHTSRTYPEYIYEGAMREELRRRGIRTTRQDKYEIVYKNKRVGHQALDLFVAQEVVVENKVVERLTRLHKAQTISYLKTVDKSVGLLLNFGGTAPKVNRLYFNPAKKAEAIPPPLPPERSVEWLYPDVVYDLVGGLFEVHSVLGAGFVHRIYANACYHELKLRGLATEAHKRLPVTYKDVVIGDIAFGHLLVEGRVILFPVAIARLADLHLDTLKQGLRWHGIRLGIIANFDAVRLEIKYLKV